MTESHFSIFQYLKFHDTVSPRRAAVVNILCIQLAHNLQHKDSITK